MYKEALIIGIFLILSACGRAEKEEKPQTRQLYLEQISLGNRTIRSLKACKDSTTADSIIRAYEDEVAKINMKYPPEADLNLSEGENDTLYIMAQRISTLVRRKLPAHAPDSIETPEPKK